MNDYLAHSRSSARAEPTPTCCAQQCQPPPRAPPHRVPIPGQEQSPLPRGFPIRGQGSGFPAQGISCSPAGGGRGAGRTQPLRILGSAFLAFLAAAPPAASRCPCSGHWPSAILSWRQSSIPLGVLLGFGGTGDTLLPVPLTRAITEADKPQSGRRELGGLGAVHQHERGFCFRFYLVGLPSLPPAPPPSSGKWPGDRVRRLLFLSGTQFLHLQNERRVSLLSAAARWSPSGSCLSAEPLPGPRADTQPCAAPSPA